MNVSTKCFLIWVTFSVCLLAPKIYAFIDFDPIHEYKWYELETNNLPIEERPTFNDWKRERQEQEDRMLDEIAREFAYSVDPWYDGSIKERD